MFAEYRESCLGVEPVSITGWSQRAEWNETIPLCKTYKHTKIQMNTNILKIDIFMTFMIFMRFASQHIIIDGKQVTKAEFFLDK